MSEGIDGVFETVAIIAGSVVLPYVAAFVAVAVLPSVAFALQFYWQ